jgi:hypothetical protein
VEFSIKTAKAVAAALLAVVIGSRLPVELRSESIGSGAVLAEEIED